MNDIKNSTLGERVLLGIIAGLFAVVGFYVGYEHLSNGVNPLLIGGITAVIVMIGCMAAAFIIEELIRKIPGRKKADSNQSDPIDETATDNEINLPSEDAAVSTPKEITAPAKRMTLMPSLKTQRLQKEKEEALPETENTQDASAKASTSDTWDEEIIVPVKPVAPVKPTQSEKREPSSGVVPKKHLKEEDTPLGLVDFIKAHPEFSARKMVKEYRLAGGTESTDNILNLMD